MQITDGFGQKAVAAWRVLPSENKVGLAMLGLNAENQHLVVSPRLPL